MRSTANTAALKYLSASAMFLAAALLAACGGDADRPATVNVARQWVSGGEPERFRWGGELQAAFWQGVLDYLQDPGRLDAILGEIEGVASEQLQ